MKPQDSAERAARLELTDHLFGLAYDDLRRFARVHVRRERPSPTLDATGLVHAVYERLAALDRIKWMSPEHVLRVAVLTMRRLLIDRARRKLAARKAIEGHRLPNSRANVMSPEEIVAFDSALTALAGIDARQSRIVELRLILGLQVAEVAEALGISTRTVERDYLHGVHWLRRAMQPLALQ